MSNYLNIAIVQAAPPVSKTQGKEKTQENYEKMVFYIDMIFQGNPAVDLIAFPEHFLTEEAEMAETIPGPLTDQLCQKAREYKKWIVPGSIMEKAEKEGEYYNTALLISPGGEIVLKYRKVFVPYPLELSTPGSEFPVFEIPEIGKIGFLICSDAHFPEAARNLALNGAEIIIKPTYQSDWIGGVRNNIPIALTRAVENQCYFISINQPAPNGMGHSVAIDPEGRIIEELGSTESFTVVYLNLDEVRRVREMGFAGMFGLLKMLKEIKQAGHPVDECYQKGIENAPIYQSLKYPNPKAPREIRKLW